jgi:hypothetical protein
VRSFPLAAMACLAVTACGPTQDPHAALLILRNRFPNGVPVSTGHTLSDSVTSGKLIVPILVEWGVVADSAGCRRINTVTVRRVGGPRRAVVDSVAFGSLPDCVMDLNPSDTLRFEQGTISLKLAGRIGIKTYEFRGPVAGLDGRGHGRSLRIRP